MVMMQRVGDSLRVAREQRGLTIEQVALYTKIRLSYIEAIELGKYNELPQPTFTKGLIRNYARFLGLPDETLLAMYRRENKETFEQPLIAPKFQMKSFISFTPKTIVRVSIGIILVILFSYFGIQYRILAGPPPLSISSPQNESIIAQETITVTGKTAPESQVSINGEIQSVNENGEFIGTVFVPDIADVESQVVDLTITATNKTSKSTIKKLTVVVKKSE